MESIIGIIWRIKLNNHTSPNTMSLTLLFQIARTHLLSKKKQTITAMLGVTFGIGMFILMIGVITGVNTYLTDSMLESTAHVRMFNDLASSNRKSILEEMLVSPQEIGAIQHQKPKNIKLSIRNGMQIVEDIKKNPDVIGVSPQLSSQVFYNYGPVQLNGSAHGKPLGDRQRLDYGRGLGKKTECKSWRPHSYHDTARRLINTEDCGNICHRKRRD
jgi:lipoprotein-releasing system permease protein